MTFKLAIIGGGAAGFFCIANILEQISSDQKIHIDIFERLSKPMLKLKATGGQRCNVTNNIDDLRELVGFYPRGEKFLYSVFSYFSCNDMIDWLSRHNIPVYVDKDGCVFPRSDDSKTIINKLLDISSKANVNINLNTVVNHINYQDKKFLVQIEDETLKYDFVLIATGGQYSIYKNYRDKSGYVLAEDLGHSIVPPKQVLSPIKIDNPSIKDLAGISLQNVSLLVKSRNKVLCEVVGDLLFTHQGISGPVVMNLTSFLQNIKYVDNSSVKIYINYGLFTNALDAKDQIESIFSLNTNKEIQNVLKQFLPKSLIVFMLKELGIDPVIKIHSLSKSARLSVIKSLQDFEISCFEPMFEQGIVSAGGVDLTEVDAKTMMSKIQENLYFAGEVLDVDGLCGGFNLQFAWSSAYVVACSILKQL